MKVPSLSRGCEMAPFFVRHTAGRAATNLEGRTNRPERRFDALFKGVSTQLGLRNAEKCVEKTFRTVCSAFQHLRLGSLKLGWVKMVSVT